MNLRDKQNSNLIKKLRNSQQNGIGFSGEGSCISGNHIFSVTTFFIPLKSIPKSILLTNIEYNNSQNLIIWKKNRFGFMTKAEVINNGEAHCTFNWEIQFKKSI